MPLELANTGFGNANYIPRILVVGGSSEDQAGAGTACSLPLNEHNNVSAFSCGQDLAIEGSIIFTMPESCLYCPILKLDMHF